MHIIAFAASKGGSGKTTLTATFSVEAAKKAKVALIDLDPQQSLAVWHEAREQHGGSGNPHLVNLDLHSDMAKITATLRKLELDKYDLVMIDTPPGLMKRIIPAVELAELVIVPVRPSPIDLNATDPIVEIAERAGKPLVFVLNQVQPDGKDGRLAANALKYLASVGKTLDPPLGLYNQHPGSMMTGQVATELRGRAKAITEAKEEITTLWRAILKELNGSNAKTSTERSTGRSV